MPPMRGKRGQERRLGERISAEALDRLLAEREVRPEVDFDIGDAEAEAADAIEAEVRAQATDGAETTDKASEAAAPVARRLPRPATVVEVGRSARRIPDLSALPGLLAATGSFASLRERLGEPAPAVPAAGRHAGLTSIPHGAKSYLAAALAMGGGSSGGRAAEGASSTGERVCWIARDAEIGDRVAEELGAWLGDPAAVSVLEPRTALAYERSELVADETAARVAALAAWRSGRARILVASVQALLQHTLPRDALPTEPRILRRGARLHLDAFLAELLDLGYVPAVEVAGRGEFARRGGIVDVFPPSSPLPVRLEFFGDEVDALRTFDPADQRTIGPIDAVELLPASEVLLPADGVAGLRARLGRRAGRLPDRLAADLARFEAAADAVA
ncbi:MAG TPA: hypothetical protein VF323_11800, partial [Candidatus Limnocylindrales bacterium]